MFQELRGVLDMMSRTFLFEPYSESYELVPGKRRTKSTFRSSFTRDASLARVREQGVRVRIETGTSDFAISDAKFYAGMQIGTSLFSMRSSIEYTKCM